MTRGEPNRIALWTYLILWVMHTSAKLNLFLGAPNLGADMLPDHLAFLVSYMARRPMNALFPLSVTARDGRRGPPARRPSAAARAGSTSVGLAMLGSLMALAVLEHWFLVVPLDGNALWRAFRRSAPRSPARRRARRTRTRRRPRSGGRVRRGAGPMSHSGPTRRGVCDAGDIERLLESIAAGRFGAVECVHGLVRTEADWLCFELREGRARMAASGPRKQKKPLVIARGQGFDRARLKAAFEVAPRPREGMVRRMSC